MTKHVGDLSLGSVEPFSLVGLCLENGIPPKDVEKNIGFVKTHPCGDNHEGNLER